MQSLREYSKALFLDYFNDYLTVEKIAEHNLVETEEMKIIIKIGRKYHEKDTKQD